MTMSFGDLLTKKMNIAAGAENAMNSVPNDTPIVISRSASAEEINIESCIEKKETILGGDSSCPIIADSESS